MRKIENNEIEPTKSLNIVLLPNKEISAQAIRLSEQISIYHPTEFSLNTTDFLPHITLFMGTYPERNITSIKSALAATTSQQPPLRIEMSGVEIVYETFVSWNVLKTPQVQQLHETVLENVNNLRAPLPSDVQLNQLSEEDAKNVRETGGVLNRNKYNPHITLTRLKDPSDASTVLKMLKKSIVPTTFQVDKLYLTTLGPHGTVSQIFNTFAFKNK